MNKMEKRSTNRTWKAWLVKNDMGPDKNGNMPEDYGMYNDPTVAIRNSDWFYESFKKWQQEGED